MSRKTCQVYTRHINPTGFTRRRYVTAAVHTEVIKPEADKQAFYTQRETRNYGPDMKGYRFLLVGGNRSARRKPTKAGMESANQIHIQPLASCIGESPGATCTPYLKLDIIRVKKFT